MSVNKRLAWGVALMLLSPLVSMVSLFGIFLYNIFPFQDPSAVVHALTALSSFAAVFGALMLITQYLFGSNTPEAAYRRVDKGMAAAVCLNYLPSVVFFIGDPSSSEAFTPSSLIHIWALVIASLGFALLWIVGLWYLRPRVVLLAVMGLITVMVIPVPVFTNTNPPSEQQGQNTVEPEGHQDNDPGAPDAAAEDADELVHGQSPSPPDSPDRRVYTTSTTAVSIPFRGYDLLLMAYSFMRLGSLRRKCEAGEPETAAA